MATAPAADGPYKLSPGPIYKPPGYGAEVGDWIGNEDPWYATPTCRARTLFS